MQPLRPIAGQTVSSVQLQKRLELGSTTLRGKNQSDREPPVPCRPLAISIVLLEKHTPCTAQDYYGRTPLHLAVLDGHEEVVKELLDYGVDTSTADFKGWTALHLAAQGYSLGVLRLLLERGADMAARDGEGMTPLHFAYQKGVTRMIDCLVEKGANREVKAIYGLTPEMLHPLSDHSKAMRTMGRNT